MRRNYFFLLIFLVSLLFINGTNADVGVGISPSKFIVAVPGGQTQDFEMIVYNPGTDSLEVGIEIEGEISKFTTVEPMRAVIRPEPAPHERPIKNSKRFKVTFSPPPSTKPKVYKGSIAASGGPAGGQFGGRVGVASLVELTVPPPIRFWDYITRTHIMIAGIILGILVLILVLRKAGLRLRFENKKRLDSDEDKRKKRK